MSITIKIRTESAAFTENPGYEVYQILHELGTKVYNKHGGLSPGDVIPVMDTNGNRVGELKVSKR